MQNEDVLLFFSFLSSLLLPCCCYCRYLTPTHKTNTHTHTHTHTLSLSLNLAHSLSLSLFLSLSPFSCIYSLIRLCLTPAHFTLMHFLYHTTCTLFGLCYFQFFSPFLITNHTSLTHPASPFSPSRHVPSRCLRRPLQRHWTLLWS